jgi:hypothetical protein
LLIELWTLAVLPLLIQLLLLIQMQSQTYDYLV